MKIEKTEKRLVEVIVEKYTLCDKCGEKVSKDNFDAFNFNLEYHTGENYPEGGSGEKTTLDLCIECAPKLIELLNNNGFKTNAKDWDY